MTAHEHAARLREIVDGIYVIQHIETESLVMLGRVKNDVLEPLHPAPFDSRFWRIVSDPITLLPGVTL